MILLICIILLILLMNKIHIIILIVICFIRGVNMNKKILFITLSLIAIILFSTSIYKKTKSDKIYITDELRKHHTALLSIVANLEKYDKDINNIDKLYIRSLLNTSREFEIALSSYNNAYNKVYSKEKQKENLKEITSLINNYYDLFLESVSLIDQIDHETLKTIKNDIEKWGLWIEDNYISTDKDGFTLYKMYTFDDMKKSGLVNELEINNYKVAIK